ncbi:hypothetical protein E4K72_14195 [Oxalobacteraceae bacterium OM1]|nr:hypothetical protein E4K72_14195 [Oxalobacteraceae bacterium OM1]
MHLFVEKCYPHVAALLAGAAWWHFSPDLPADEKEFLAAALSLGAVLTGFIATAQAILMALPTDSVMGRLRTTGYVNDLILYLSDALQGGMAFSVLNVVGFFLIKPGQHLPTLFAVLWIFFGVFSICAFVRVSKIMLKIMR